MVTPMTSTAYRLSNRANTMKASEIRELLKLVGRPGMISFAGGIPDPALFNVDLFQKAYGEIFATPDLARVALQYSATEGYLPLRQWIADHMASLGVPVDVDNILVTTGSQQALDLIGKTFIDPGSTIAVERPTYLGALQSFSAYEPSFVLAGAPQATGDAAPRLCYLIPDFANPTGLTMTLAQRHAAIERARTLGSVIIEDAAYTAMRFDGETVPALLSLDIASAGSIDEARTLYCGTFSKTLAPGLRIGWICGPKVLISKLVTFKQGTDLHTPTVDQMAMLYAAQNGLEQQIASARAVYRQRRDAMDRALHAHAPAGTHWTKPEGGMFFWVTAPEHIDTRALLATALEHDVAFVPGAAFHADGSGHNTMRLNFSLCDEAQIETGIARLCRLIADAAPASAIRTA